MGEGSFPCRPSSCSPTMSLSLNDSGTATTWREAGFLGERRALRATEIARSGAVSPQRAALTSDSARAATLGRACFRLGQRGLRPEVRD